MVTIEELDKEGMEMFPRFGRYPKLIEQSKRPDNIIGKYEGHKEEYPLHPFGWKLEKQATLCIDHIDFVSIRGVYPDTTGIVLDITPLNEYKLVIMGKSQVPMGVDKRTAHSLRVRFADKYDNDIPPKTQIIITKETNEDIYEICNIKYKDISLIHSTSKTPSEYNTKYKIDRELYRFDDGIELIGNNEHMRIYVRSPPNGISAEHVFISLDCDILSKIE